MNQSGTRLLVAASSFKTSDYRAMVEETVASGSIGAGLLERVVYLDTDDWDDLVAGGETLDADALEPAASARSSRTTRSTSSTRRAPPASPRAPPSATATSSTTATSPPS